ncbi:MAG TPA: hypothetical protein VJ748_04215 [Vitreimonas sp.]|jgi:hypothetical protein|nr:hypothetical protein [Vitreimonas sp.]
MRGTGKGRTIKLNPVDEASVTDHPDRHRMVALEDRNLFNLRIKSERASAYWFAASLWGVTGLIMGAFLGVYITLAVQTGSADIWRENFISGQAAREASESVNRREPLLPSDNAPQDE